MAITWSQLGSPIVPGNVRIEGLGNVTVTQENIDDVAQAGGDPSFDLVESTSMGAKVRQYMLGLMQ